MTKLLAVCCIAVFAGFAIQTSAQEKQALRMVRTIPLIEPDANRLFYDPATNLIYFGYGGQNAGFDAYERVGILQPKPAAGYDRLVADMIAPTPRPGHLAEIAMDDDGLLLICDSRADLIYQFDTRKRELIKSWPGRGDGAGDMALDRFRQQKDADQYDLISKIKTRPGSGTSLLVPQFNRFYVASQAIGDQEAAILVFEPVP